MNTPLSVPLSVILGYVGAALLAGALAMLALLVARRQGPVARAYLRTVVAMDVQLRALHAPLDGRQLLLIQLATVVVTLALGATVDARLALLAVLAAVGPWAAFPVLRRRRIKRIEDQLAGWLSMLGNLLQATGSVMDAMAHTAEFTRAPLGQEVDLLLKELQLGVPLPEALQQMARRTDSSLIGAIVTIVLVGRKTGGELPRILHETAAALRERKRLEGVLRKQTAMGRSQMMVLLLAPPVIVYMFRRVEPTFFDPLFQSGAIGHLVIGMALLLWMASAIMARRILAIDI